MMTRERDSGVQHGDASPRKCVCIVVRAGGDGVVMEAFRREGEWDLHVKKGFNGALNR